MKLTASLNDLLTNTSLTDEVLKFRVKNRVKKP